MFEFARLIPLYSIEKREPHYVKGYFLVQELTMPRLYPEFDPGPQDEKEARFYNTRVDVFFITIDFGPPTVRNVGYHFMKERYNEILGRSDRIYYWQIMKELESLNTKEGEGNETKRSHKRAMQKV